jgi:CRISPR-associated exonuclease Cas4
LSESEGEELTVADIKRYAWCPRIIYFTHVLHLEERITEAMQEGKQEHDEAILAPIIAQLRGRRVLKGLELRSETLRLAGKPDFIVETKFGELVPVEIKWASMTEEGRPKRDHKIQLACYALLIEELLKRPVKRCAVYYLRDRRVAYIELSTQLKIEAKKAIYGAHGIIESEEMPYVRQPLSKCVNCGYFSHCYPPKKGTARELLTKTKTG